MPHGDARTLGGPAGKAQATHAAPSVAPSAARAAEASGTTSGERSRRELVRLADRMLVSVRPYASEHHALVTLPGPEGGYGRAVDGLEGFARSFLLAGFRITGEQELGGLDELADWYAQGLAAGTDPHSNERWVRLDEHGQAKVEAASIALILDMTRPWIWDRLTPLVQEQVIDYLSPAVGDPTYPPINWVWFRLVVQTFLRSVGGPWSAEEMAQDLATHDSFLRSGGWLADGRERAYDHYTGWALHLYPALWARMAGAADLAPARRDRDMAMLDRFLRDAVALVGADGSPLIQGRSLIYRFAAAAPFWVGALAGVRSVPPGLLRRAATRIIGHFAEHGAPDERGLLTIGWHGAWPRMAQSYSGPGSPYWASKGMLGIALPADHPVWTAPDEDPLPVEAVDFVRAAHSPGWIISGTRADGIVRVVNHGTDHAVEGATSGDSPLYARLGYSTATFPVLDESGWAAPEDQSVALIDGAGRASHRSGMRLLAVHTDNAEGGTQLGVAGSVTEAHWLDAEPGRPDHGTGRAGRSSRAGRITVFSLVRGPWELRLARIDGAEAAAVRLRIGGWPVAGEGTAATSAGTATATGTGLVSRVSSVASGVISGTGPGGISRAAGTGGVTEHAAGGPLGRPVRVPWLDHPVRSGTWIVTLIELSGAGRPAGERHCHIELDQVGARLTVRASWPDGAATLTSVDTSRTPGEPPR